MANSKLQMAVGMFSRSVNTTGIVRLLRDVKVSGKSQLAALTGNRFEITCILNCIHDTNEISTAIPCYRGPATHWHFGRTVR